ncbi:MAG: hypothetical protein WCK01_01040 [Candidatus Uhrbacteria bacterium]
MRNVCWLLIVGIFSCTGCEESRTQTEISPLPVRLPNPSVRVLCENPPDPVTYAAGVEVEAIACSITSNREVEFLGTDIYVEVIAGMRNLVRGSRGTMYFTRFRTFVRETGATCNGPMEISQEVEPGSDISNLVESSGSILLHAEETATIVLAFTIASSEDAPGELFTSDSYAAYRLTWGDDEYLSFPSPVAFRLIENGVPTRPLVQRELTGDRYFTRVRTFLVRR